MLTRRAISLKNSRATLSILLGTQKGKGEERKKEKHVKENGWPGFPRSNGWEIHISIGTAHLKDAGAEGVDVSL